jgi:hypothetical protein
MSFCNNKQSSTPLIILNTLESSANRATVLELATEGMSLMNKRNNIGPKIEPWGTPEITGNQSEF